jgi:hypothetical protein
MLKNAPIIPYIPVADVARARKFYEEKVGLKPKQEYAGGVISECGKARGHSCTHPRERARRRPVRHSGQLTMSSPKSLNSRREESCSKSTTCRGIKTENSIASGGWCQGCLVQRYRRQYSGCEPKGVVLGALSCLETRCGLQMPVLSLSQL